MAVSNDHVKKSECKTLGLWLRRQREQREWSQHRMARMIIEAARAEGDTALPYIKSVEHNIYRWERGVNQINERYRFLYCRALGIPPEQFGPSPADALPSRLLPPITSATYFAINDISKEDIVKCLLAIGEVIGGLLESIEQKEGRVNGTDISDA